MNGCSVVRAQGVDRHRSRCGRRVGFAVAVVSVVAVLGIAALASSGAARALTTTGEGAAQRSDDPVAVTYHPPVDAPVTDPFRPPRTPYGPGNRGIAYATVPGTTVQAAADGVVVFAGPVAGGLHVTVLHRDGVRTSYSFLAVVRVVRGEVVRGGDTVGIAAAMLHVGARRGDIYIDPGSLWGQPVRPPVVHLVPLDGYEPPPAQAAARRSVPPERPAAGVLGDELKALGTRAVQGALAGVGRRPP